MALSAVPDEDIERDLVRRSALLDTVDEYREWDRECLEFVNTLRVRCRIRRQRMCVGPYFSQIARLVRIEGLRDVVRRRFERVGADGRLNDRRSFFWVEVETAFVRRVLTGAIVNVTISIHDHSWRMQGKECWTNYATLCRLTVM